jgi:low temperature requirement protein LtrA
VVDLPADAPNRRRLAVPMVGRSIDEEHRAATPLELFFDLVFVVAVAQASTELHHGLAEGKIGFSVLSYAMVFFAIWWAWMNVTWFGSAYDTDDIPYRIAMFVEMTGALILAAGIPRAFEQQDWTIVTIGYVVMRLALVPQWLRASVQDPLRRATARRFAIGISLGQVYWISLLFFPQEARIAGFLLGVAIELLIPVFAERNEPTPWHPGHIQERYGLFTLIVLGESILSASLAVQVATAEAGLTVELASIVAGGLLIVFSMWWLYFDFPTDGMLEGRRHAFAWGYGHLFVFASAAAVGAGLAVETDFARHHAEIDSVTAGAAVAVPVAIFMGTLWLLHEAWEALTVPRRLLVPAAIVLVLLTPLTGWTVPLIGALLVALVATKVVRPPEPVRVSSA